MHSKDTSFAQYYRSFVPGNYEPNLSRKVLIEKGLLHKN